MDAEDWIESVIRALMCLAGILGNNWLAFSSLPRSKAPFRTNEALFINLAVSNLITNYLVDLPDTMADFADNWFLGETYCGVFRFCADLSETSSIFTTFFISVFWYQKIVGSLKRGGAPVQLDSLRLVVCLLAGSWTVAVVFSIPHVFFLTIDGGNGSQQDCIDVIFPDPFARQTYETLYLTLANVIPLAGIVYASIQIIITLLQNKTRIKALKPEHTKGTAKDSIKDPERGYAETSISTVDNQGDIGSSGDKDFPSLTIIHPNLPSCSFDEGLSGHSSLSSPLYSETHKENTGKAPPDPPKPSQAAAKLNPGSSTQVRAAKSVVAVASVFLVCWLTHIMLRITNNIHTSSVVVEVASYIAASYTCIIPYIFLHGVKKLSCSCRG